MNFHKQKLLNDFDFLNLKSELIEKIKSENVSVYESYLLIIDVMYSNTKREIKPHKY